MNVLDRTEDTVIASLQNKPAALRPMANQTKKSFETEIVDLLSQEEEDEKKIEIEKPCDD